MSLLLRARVRFLWLSFALAFSASCVSAMPPPPPPPPAPPEAPLFYEQLAPYGDWWWHETHGWVFTPYVDGGWRPYTVGHWVWTQEYGWLWVSGEPFGWACHHYGRWLWIDDAGWVWVPGRVWAPAWVVWRYTPGYIGWAPLGPDAVWVPGRGFVIVEVDSGISPHAWVFVDEPDILVVNVVTVVHSDARNHVLLPKTRVVHRPERGDDDRVVNAGIDRSLVQRATGQAVIPQRVVERGDREVPGGGDAASAGAVTIRRARALEETRGEPDLPPPPIARPGAHDGDVRPLRTPADDVDRRIEDEKRRAAERHDKERRASPSATPPEEIQREQRQELDELERQKAKEKASQDKKKKVPRKIYPKRKAAPAEKK